VSDLQDKYVVIKQEDWDAFRNKTRTGASIDVWRDMVVELAALPIDGGHFVVREQDVFAPAGLHAYAYNIHTAVEFNDTLGLAVMEEETRARLMALADDIAGTALKWEAGRTLVKIPD
jgi:hypothetical protein